jgi:threonylcarbamoyladenosine tRNA methylthiotransferase MtaB
MPTFRIITLGCKVNHAESDAIAARLTGPDWRAATASEEADLCIINTCAVTQKAAMQSRQALRHMIRANPRAFVAVTGCDSQADPHGLMNIKGLDGLIDQEAKAWLPEILSACGLAKHQRPVFLKAPAASLRQAPAAQAVPLAGRTRPFLKIQDGCDAFCTYCIVPYARGPSRSNEPHAVLAGIAELAVHGFKEVVLTGIHLGLYGRDLQPATCLADLLHAVDASNTPVRVRLSSIEPLELTADIIDLVARSGRFCRHFHIPLQSGDPEVLRRMKRPYSPEVFTALVRHIHDTLPDAAIGADVLVGFPGETEAAFENTFRLVETLPLSYVHVFPFSPRPGTPAHDFPDQVPPHQIKQRCVRLRELGNRKRLDFHRRFIGQRVQVLIEGKRDKSGWLKGVSSNYLPVLVEGGDECMNQIRPVIITRTDAFRLMGIFDLSIVSK